MGAAANIKEVIALEIKALQDLHQAVDASYEKAVEMILASQGKLIKASRLYSAAQAQFERIGNHLQPADQIEIDRYIITVRERLDHDVFDTACTEGKKMSFAEAIVYALEGSD